MRSIDIHAHLTPQAFWKGTENGGVWNTITSEQDSRGRQIMVVGLPSGRSTSKRQDTWMRSAICRVTVLTTSKRVASAKSPW